MRRKALTTYGVGSLPLALRVLEWVAEQTASFDPPPVLKQVDWIWCLLVTGCLCLGQLLADVRNDYSWLRTSIRHHLSIADFVRLSTSTKSKHVTSLSALLRFKRSASRVSVSMTVISHRLSKTFALQKQFHALRNEELRIDVAELEPHGFTAGVWNPEGDRLPIMSKARYYVLISVKMAFRPTQVFSFYLMFGDFDQPQSMPVFIASDDVNLFLDPVFHHDLYGLTYVYKDNQIGS